MKCQSTVLLLALFASPLARAEASTVTVEVNAAQVSGVVRDVFGVNKKPTASSQTAGIGWDATSLYPAFGITQVRLHDSGVDLCTTYTAATKLNMGVSPAQAVQGCTLQGVGARPHLKWTPTSTADTDLNNPDNYDFSTADEALLAVIATGSQVYLRLGESYNGANDTDDPVAWAKVATNIYRHVIGEFKPTAGIAVNPVFVEIFNEPDGGFWAGPTATFNTLFTETSQRVRAAAAAAGRTVKVGGAGFTRNVLARSAEAGNVANGFIAAVGASNIDFYSAHLYNNCSTATLASSANFLRSLRTVVNAQGGSDKPMQITEWNIGLGSQCGNAFYAEPRTQSFASGILTLMQDPAQNIEAAHFYTAMPIMALFDFSTVAGTVRINPSAWSLWAHSRLRGANMLATQVCPQGVACVAGYAAESAPLLALSAQSGAGQSVVITNDSAAAVNYTLRVQGLSTSEVTAAISTPPSAAKDLLTVGNPGVADASALAAMLAAVPKETRIGLAVSGGSVDISLTIPAYSLQLVELQSAAASTMVLGTGWNLVGNGGTTALSAPSLFGDASKIYSLWKWVKTGSAPNITYPNWAFYTPGQSDSGAAYAASKGYDTFTSIASGEGFWVNAKATFSVPMTAPAWILSSVFAPDQSKALTSGWSLIATGEAQTARAFNQTMGSAPPTPGVVANNLTSVWAWQNSGQRWYFYAPSLDTSGELSAYLSEMSYLDFGSVTFAPTMGFWVNRP